MTQAELDDLISCSKRITGATPPSGYKSVQEGRYRRRELEVEKAEQAGGSYLVFIRQSTKFEENFTVGLRYKTKEKLITLVRYNGPHGESSRDNDGHFNKPHIHRITIEEVNSESMEPQEKHRDTTSKYSSLEEALVVFFRDVGVKNYLEYFPEIRQRELSL